MAEELFTDIILNLDKPKPKIKIQGSGSKTGKQQIVGAPKGTTSDKEILNLQGSAEFPITENVNFLVDGAYNKFRDNIEYKDNQIFLEDAPSERQRKVGIGINQGGEGFGGYAKYDIDNEKPELFVGYKKTFADGGSPMDDYKHYVLKSELSEKVIQLMDEEGYEFGEAVREAMRQGYKKGNKVESKMGKGVIYKTFKDKNALKLLKWIKENPDFDYNKYNALEIAEEAGIKKGDLSTSLANRVLTSAGKETLRVAQSKAKTKLYNSKEFKNYLKSKNVTFESFLKLSPRMRDKQYLYPYQRQTALINQLPDKGKNYINSSQLAEILKPYGINYGSFSSENKTKQTLLAKKINEVLNSKTVKPTGEGTFGKQKAKISGERSFTYYKKPTKSQLQEIAKFKDSPNLRTNTVEAMKVLDKKLKTDFKNKKFPSLEKTQAILKNAGLEHSPAQAARAMSQLARAYGGTQFQNTLGEIKINKPVGNWIQKTFGTYDLLHPWRQGIYNAAFDDIKSAVGDKAGDLKKFKNQFDNYLRKTYPGVRTFDINEVFSVTASAKNKSYPYAYFVDLIDSNLNQIDLASFHGQMSLAEERVSNKIKQYRRTGNIKFFNEAMAIATKFNNQTRKSFLNTINKNYPGNSVNLTELKVGPANQVLKSKNFAGNYYKKSKLNKWKNLGIDIDAHSSRSGYIKTGASKRGTVPIKELFTKKSNFQKVDKSKVNALIKSVGPEIKIIKEHAASKGVKLNSFAGFMDFADSGIELPPAVRQAASRVLEIGGKFLRGFGKAAVVLDPMFAAYDFSSATGKGATGKDAGIYAGQRFFEGLANLPDLAGSGIKYAVDFLQGKKGDDLKFEQGALYEPFDFAQRNLEEKLEAMPKSQKLRNIANKDFDVGIGASMRMVDDMEIPASRNEIEKARQKYLKGQLGPYYKYGIETLPRKVAKPNKYDIDT